MSVEVWPSLVQIGPKAAQTWPSPTKSVGHTRPELGRARRSAGWPAGRSGGRAVGRASGLLARRSPASGCGGLSRGRAVGGGVGRTVGRAVGLRRPGGLRLGANPRPGRVSTQTQGQIRRDRPTLADSGSSLVNVGPKPTSSGPIRATSAPHVRPRLAGLTKAGLLRQILGRIHPSSADNCSISGPTH